VRADLSSLSELVEKYQSRSTPTIVVDDKVMMGFDPKRLEQLLSE
jgi:hypothetical protein